MAWSAAVNAASTRAEEVRAMGAGLLVGLLAGTAVIGPLVVLTAMGARSRGRTITVAAVAGLFFPITWVCWYVCDEHPYRRAGHPGGSAPSASHGVSR